MSESGTPKPLVQHGAKWAPTYADHGTEPVISPRLRKQLQPVEQEAWGRLRGSPEKARLLEKAADEILLADGWQKGKLRADQPERIGSQRLQTQSADWILDNGIEPGITRRVRTTNEGDAGVRLSTDKGPEHVGTYGLDELLDRLPLTKSQRPVVRLALDGRREDHKWIQEAADILGIKPATVKKHWSDALKRIRAAGIFTVPSWKVEGEEPPLAS